MTKAGKVEFFELRNKLEDKLTKDELDEREE